MYDPYVKLGFMDIGGGLTNNNNNNRRRYVNQVVVKQRSTRVKCAVDEV